MLLNKILNNRRQYGRNGNIVIPSPFESSWDISTITDTSNRLAVTNPTGGTQPSTDGTKLFSASADTIKRASLGANGSLFGASWDSGQVLSCPELLQGFRFMADGLNIGIVHGTGTGYFKHGKLAVAWDLTTVTWGSDISIPRPSEGGTNVAYPKSVHIKPDLSKVWISGRGKLEWGEDMYTNTTTTANGLITALNLQAATAGTVERGTQQSGFNVAKDGEQYFVTGGGGIYQAALNPVDDPASAYAVGWYEYPFEEPVPHGNAWEHTKAIANITKAAINNDGRKCYVVKAPASNEIEEWEFAAAA